MKYRTLLEKTSEKSDHSKYRVGAILVRRSNVVNFGFNHLGTNRLIEKNRRLREYNRSVHAEVHAILGVSKEVASRCYLYVGRFTLDGRTANAKPCEMCQAILREMGVKKIFYTTKDCDLYSILILR